MNSLNTTKKASECYPGTSGEWDRAPQPIEGAVILSPSGGLFHSNLVAIWRQFGNILFTTVCDSTDNLVLVANTMVLIVDRVTRRFGINKIEKRIMDEPDEIEIIISPFFRQGSPLIVNHSLHRFMMKEDGNIRAFIA
jgi:hypothetical protein